VEWILKLLKSNEFTHAQLVEIIGIKIDKLKKELNRARVRTHTDRLYDSIQSLEWLGYVLSFTNRGASFIYGIHYFLPFFFSLIPFRTLVFSHLLHLLKFTPLLIPCCYFSFKFIPLFYSLCSLSPYFHSNSVL
jgi:hypothetical protein